MGTDRPERIRATDRVARLVATTLLCGIPSACVDSTGPPHPLIEETEFADELGIDLARMERRDGGLYVEELVAGTGEELVSRRRVRVNYDLYVPDGRLALRREGAVFILGCRQVIDGLEAGVYGMRVGGKRRLVVPPRMGYGDHEPFGVDLPPHSILVYVVEAVRASRQDTCRL